MRTKPRSKLLGLSLSIFLATSFLVTLAFASDIAVVKKNEMIKRSHPCIEAGTKKTVFYIGYEDKERKPIFAGTCFLIMYDNLTYAVTAKHVVTGLEKLRADEVTFFP